MTSSICVDYALNKQPEGAATREDLTKSGILVEGRLQWGISGDKKTDLRHATSLRWGNNGPYWETWTNDCGDR